jgi:hypothetical protein
MRKPAFLLQIQIHFNRRQQPQAHTQSKAIPCVEVIPQLFHSSVIKPISLLDQLFWHLYQQSHHVIRWIQPRVSSCCHCFFLLELSACSRCWTSWGLIRWAQNGGRPRIPDVRRFTFRTYGLASENSFLANQRRRFPIGRHWNVILLISDIV